ncbi:DUF262 domain-containing protein [Sphingorhabdus lacus]|nr:DUF262 domain-containing protein [Sphingorhabdus lacus]
MSLNSIIQPSRPTVSQIVEQFRKKDMFVDNSFQRRLVWTERQKVRLIETILMGYPMPEIYVWQQPADADTGKQQLSIVDGQQRITAMTQFVTNEWKLSKAYLDNEAAEYVDRPWKDLPDAIKQQFWDYVINVRTIPSNVDAEQIKAIFKRLNETDKSLNPQELRNAEFNGTFIKLAETIADLPQFGELRAFTDHQIRRMADVQFTSGMLMFLRRGLLEETITTINETYDLYNDQYEEAEQDLAAVQEFLDDCYNIYFCNGRVRSFFSKQVHLFTLFCVDQSLKAKGANRDPVPAKLNSFVETYEDNPNTSEIIEKYREGASSRTRSRASRALRLNNLMKWIVET